MPVSENQTGTFSSDTSAHAEIIPTNLLTSSKNGQENAGKTVTKVTTTFTTTKITTKKMAIGDEREIAAFMAKPMEIPPMAGFETLTGSEDDTGTEVRKVSFPQEPASVHESTGSEQASTSIYEGKLLKYGFRLFAKNWYSVDVRIHRDGSIEWVKTNDTERRHKINLKELPIGLITVGSTCLQIPTYLSAKFGKAINPEHLIAIGRRKKLRLKSYWFLANSDEELQKVKSALLRVVGYDFLDLPISEVRKMWLGQGNIHAPNSDDSNAENGLRAAPIQPLAVEGGEDDGSNVKIQTPRQANKKAKEAFFKS